MNESYALMNAPSATALTCAKCAQSAIKGLHDEVRTYTHTILSHRYMENKNNNNNNKRCFF